MLDGAIVIPIQTMVWNLLFELAALLWMVDRALLNVGYFVIVLTGWLTQNVFSPLLGFISDQTSVLVAPLFLIAVTVLGFTYLMAVFGRFDVVSLRSAVMWLLFAATLYTFGPGVYTGLEDFRRLVGGGFYEAGVDAFNNANTATGLNAIGTTPSDVVAVPSDQFGQFLPGVAGASAIDGLDVAMAYVGADGFDVLAAAGAPHPIARLPWLMVAQGQGGFFDPDTGPPAFGSMSDADRQASIGRALQGVWRVFTASFIAVFGIVEQLVNLLMAASFAVAFFSMFIAVLFGFFIRTEPIAWGALQLILELFIQSVINSLLMSLILGFVMVGANTGNAILLLGAVLVGLWLGWNLLQGCVKGLLNASERLYKSFSASTGGSFATVSETNKVAGTATVSAVSGASVLAGGGSFLQALGATFGDARTAQTMNYASRMLGGEETLLGSAAKTLGEGASARSLAGPLGGYLLGQQRADERQATRDGQARRAYRGAYDRQRDDALTAYDAGGDSDALQGAFSPKEARQVLALRDTFGVDDFTRVVGAVRGVRNDNPSLPPQSPAFTAKVRQELPSPLKEMEAPALDDFAQIFGAPADPSPYARALTRYPRDAEADSFTPADAQRVAQLLDASDDDDLAQSAYAMRANAQAARRAVPSAPVTPPARYRQNVNAEADSFTPADAQRVAQLLDASDDDDFAQSTYAMRATARASDPFADAPPPRDTLTSEEPPAWLDAVPAPYLGKADRARDGALAAYRQGDARALRTGFSAQDADAVAALSTTYERDDFDAVVSAVRRTRHANPSLPAGSIFAVRATRKQLPERLRQMSSKDLTTFSSVFGGLADAPQGTPAPVPPPVLAGNPLTPNSTTEEPFVVTSDRFTPAQDMPIPTMRGLGVARLERLNALGVSTLGQLGAASAPAIASALRVSEAQVQGWQAQAHAYIALDNELPSTPPPANVAPTIQAQPAPPPPPAQVSVPSAPPPPSRQAQATPPPVNIAPTTQAQPTPLPTPAQVSVPSAPTPPPSRQAQAMPPPPSRQAQPTPMPAQVSVPPAFVPNTAPPPSRQAQPTPPPAQVNVPPGFVPTPPPSRQAQAMPPPPSRQAQPTPPPANVAPSASTPAQVNVPPAFVPSAPTPPPSRQAQPMPAPAPANVAPSASTPAQPSGGADVPAPPENSGSDAP